MSETCHESMRVIVYRECEAWVAQVLEHDISAQGVDFQSAIRRLTATVNAECRHTVQKHGREFEGIDPAPAIFEQMWNDVEQSLQADNLEFRIAA